MHVAQRFEHLLDTFRRLDGSRWTGQQLDEATDGVVARSYVTNLRKGRIENPGYEKMRAIAKAMGFPPEAWFEDVDDRIGKRRKGNMANAWRYSLEQPGTAKSRMCGDEIKNPLDLFEEAVSQARNATIIPIARVRELETRSLENFKYAVPRVGSEPGRAPRQQSPCVRCRHSTGRSAGRSRQPTLLGHERLADRKDSPTSEGLHEPAPLQGA